MVYDPKVHHRRSIRLRSWDYTWPWWYYVTIVVKDRECQFGKVIAGNVVLSDLGSAAEGCWTQIPNHHKGVELDDHVFMPDHLHGIIVVNGTSRRDVQSRKDVQLNLPTGGHENLFPTKSEAMGALSPDKGSLSVIVRTFKAAVTTWARRNGFSDFLWQPGFYDHVIRNEADLHRIRLYIANNPLQWTLDEENPEQDIM